MKLESKSNCPLNSFNPCKLWDCSWFVEIKGTHPQTGTELNEWGCAMAWLPVMLINNAREQHATAVAVESFRNEMVKANESSQQALLAAMHLSAKNSAYLQVTNVKGESRESDHN